MCSYPQPVGEGLIQEGTGAPGDVVEVVDFRHFDVERRLGFHCDGRTFQM